MDLRPFFLGFDWGCMHEPFMVPFLVIPLPNPWVKVLNFEDFLGFRKVAVLVEILRFLLIQRVLVDQIVAMWCPWGTPSIHKLVRIRGVNQEIGKVVWRGWLAARFSPRAPRPWLVWPVSSIGLTSAAPCWDLARVNYLVHVALGCGVSSLYLAGFKVVCLVLWRVFFPFS
jgi:hypothetical protein